MSRVLYIMIILFFSCAVEDEENYFGCTDENALNFDSSAIENDNSCLYSEGCTDSNACNYNELAIEDDGSCKYPETLVYQSKNERDIQSIINQKCTNCHISQGLAPLNYSVLTQQGGQVLKNFINGTANNYSYNIMPPPGSTPLTNCEKVELLTWIENGMD